ncbi:cell wall anchor protein [Micromonospora sp. U21]|uniref:cell wall anchor protein n=1 Tax=Micromonospora sp. U21 TaxID=2824899 RepID=UPI001B365C70|nr:cell wall anchor protein [Micromonospora sp. U21]MBQ0900675.1 cell wall anchor protein [Micromonospora sp. U21]
MNPPKSPFRRVAAIAAGALIGIAGVATVATPAFAHHSTISGTACETNEDGVYRVQWTVVNSEDDLDATITEVWTPSNTYVNGIPAGRELPKSTDGKVVGVQYTAKGAALDLKITAEWTRDGRLHTNTATGTAVLDETCAAEPPTATPTPGAPTPTPTVTPSAGPSSPAPTTPAPTTPAPTTAVPTPQPSEPTGPLVPEEPNAPVFEIIFDCDALVISADNPADGVAATIVLTTEKGVSKKLELTPGKKTEVSFDAYEGLTVTPSIDGEEADPADAVKWAKPADCGEGEGGGLPLTGANTTMIAGGAVVLLAAGAGLFMMARRRRLRFTA